MKIQVLNGIARINCDVPIFIGSTSTLRYQGGEMLSDFAFGPLQGESGTLVFDHADPTRRNPLSADFFQYSWEDDKLVVREGFNSGRYKKPLNRSAASGFSCTIPNSKPPRVYYTGKGDNYICTKTRVGVLALLRFVEGKINEDELKACAIE